MDNVSIQKDGWVIVIMLNGFRKKVGKYKEIGVHHHFYPSNSNNLVHRDDIEVLKEYIWNIYGI